MDKQDSRHQSLEPTPQLPSPIAMDVDQLPIIDPWLTPDIIISQPPSPLFDDFPVLLDTHGIADAIKAIDEPFDLNLDPNNNDNALRELYQDLDLPPCP